MQFTPHSTVSKENQKETVYLFTREQAMAFVRQRGFAIYTHVSVDMPIEEDQEHYFPGRAVVQLTHND